MNNPKMRPLLSPMPAKFFRYSLLVMTLSVSLFGCKQQAAAPAAAAPAVVVVKAIESKHIKDVILLDGTISPSEQVNLVARVPGNLDSVHFKDGQWVKKGDLLFTIERPPYLDQLKLVQAKLDQSQSDYARQKELLKENANSETNVENSLSNLQQAQANVDIAKTNLSYTEVRAPFDGVMGKRQVDPGNFVGATAGGTILGTIMKIAPIYVNAAVGENEAIRIRHQRNATQKEIGNSVDKTVVYAQLQGETEPSATGVLNFIDHQLNQSSGTIAVRGEFPNDKHHLIPGFYAKLSIEASEGRNALVLPRSVVQTDQQGDYVFTVGNDNIAHRRYVTIAPLPQENIEVTKGLTAGERVVIEGYGRISDGQAVQIGGQPSTKA